MLQINLQREKFEKFMQRGTTVFDDDDDEDEVLDEMEELEHAGDELYEKKKLKGLLRPREVDLWRHEFKRQHKVCAEVAPCGCVRSVSVIACCCGVLGCVQMIAQMKLAALVQTPQFRGKKLNAAKKPPSLEEYVRRVAIHFHLVSLSCVDGSHRRASRLCAVEERHPPRERAAANRVRVVGAGVHAAQGQDCA